MLFIWHLGRVMLRRFLEDCSVICKGEHWLNLAFEKPTCDFRIPRPPVVGNDKECPLPRVSLQSNAGPLAWLAQESLRF